MRSSRHPDPEPPAEPQDEHGDPAGRDNETDEELLASPLDDSDLADRITSAGGRRWRRSTVVLACLVLLSFGFALGAMAGRATTEIRAAIAQAQASQDVDPTAASAGGVGGVVEGDVAEPGPGTIIQGRIRAVDDDGLYVEAADGTTTRVLTTDATRVALTSPLDLGDLSPGANVVVTGEEAGGIVTATAVEQEGASTP